MQRPASLREKTEHALAALRSAAARHACARSAVAFTGGKDSTLALFLWRRVLAERDPAARALAINLDTGLKFPEILAFRDALAGQWKIDLHIARPTLFSVPAAVDKTACCAERKIAPLAAALDKLGITLLITGIRADEHASRAALPVLERRETHERLHPLLDFTEMDIWAATQKYGLPWCGLYNQGYRSLGCVPCTALPGRGGTERSGRAAEKEAVMDDLRALGYF